ncbi:MAG: hypothetical protein EU532_10645 [Promethearchaeota archaeon]|nr:MAG: hypothetical protein EU532_10645 [Candidatus Lokiarchaeota archaeon]
MQQINYKKNGFKDSLIEVNLKFPALEAQIIDDSKDILRYLHLGTSIPVVQEFYEFIIPTLKAYMAKAIILKEQYNNEIFTENTDNHVGLTLIYNNDQDTLFFGLFGVYDHSECKISVLIDELIKYAKSENYKYIRGPINIPAVIFGWGFMAEGSNKSQFIGCPVNPPIYQRCFQKKGFYVKFEEDRYDVVVIKMNPYNLKRRDGSLYDFGEYEYKNPKKEEIWDCYDEMKNLHMKYMPPSAQISPVHPINFKTHINFIYKYGTESHIWIVYHKPTGKMVAWGHLIPNPFSRDKRDRIDSASFHYWVVHPDHRRNGLAMLMYGATSQKVYREGLRRGSWPVGSENKANAKAAKKMKGVRDRRHLILELKL